MESWNKHMILHWLFHGKAVGTQWEVVGSILTATYFILGVFLLLSCHWSYTGGFILCVCLKSFYYHTPRLFLFTSQGSESWGTKYVLWIVLIWDDPWQWIMLRNCYWHWGLHISLCSPFLISNMTPKSMNIIFTRILKSITLEQTWSSATKNDSTIECLKCTHL